MFSRCSHMFLDVLRCSQMISDVHRCSQVFSGCSHEMLTIFWLARRDLWVSLGWLACWVCWVWWVWWVRWVLWVCLTSWVWLVWFANFGYIWVFSGYHVWSKSIFLLEVWALMIPKIWWPQSLWWSTSNFKWKCGLWKSEGIRWSPSLRISKGNFNLKYGLWKSKVLW